MLPQPGKAPRRVTNTRDDKVQSAFWRESFQKPSLVPASSFCEPNSSVRPARWTWFALGGEDPRPLFAFAGLWRVWEGPIKKDGPPVTRDVFPFMTTTPNELVATVNHERMPVLLTSPEAQDQWLDGSDEGGFALCRPYLQSRCGLSRQDTRSETFSREHVIAGPQALPRHTERRNGPAAVKMWTTVPGVRLVC